MIAQPVPLSRRRELPPFPVDALPQPLAAMVGAVAEFTQTDPGMAGTTAIGMLAAAAGGRVQIEATDGWREPLNLFTATVAGPGERKSAVQAVMAAPLQDAEQQLTEVARSVRLEATITKDVAAKAAEAAKAAAGRADGSDRNRLLADAIGAQQAAEAVVVPPLPRLLADDVTPERCAGLLAEQHGRLAVVSAEGGVFDVIGGRYSNGVPSMDVWLKGHSGDTLRVDRQSREPEFIQSPALTLALMIQPSVLVDIARNGAFRGRGLLARFLFAMPTSKVGWRTIGAAPVPAAVRDAYNNLLAGLARDLADWHDPAVLQLTTEAHSLVLTVARQIEPQLAPTGELGHIADWGSKLVGAIVRITGLMHLAEHPTDGWRRAVEQSSVERAVRLGGYYRAHALAAFDQMRANPAVAEAEYLLDVIRRLGESVVSRRALHVAASRSRFPKVEHLDEPLRLLEEHGYLVRLPDAAPKGPGRPPSPTFAVHPDLITETTQATERSSPTSSVDSVISVATQRRFTDDLN
jgi:replicative DNA helicase